MNCSDEFPKDLLTSFAKGIATEAGQTAWKKMRIGGKDMVTIAGLVAAVAVLLVAA